MYIRFAKGKNKIHIFRAIDEFKVKDTLLGLNYICVLEREEKDYCYVPYDDKKKYLLVNSSFFVLTCLFMVMI